jgi:predicted PilT family ATPase
MAGIYMMVARQPPPISVTTFATELNRYRVSNGYSILTFEESLNDRALQLAEKIDQTGKADTSATITHQLDFTRSSGQLITDISRNTNDNDALLRSDISSAGFGMSKKTVVILLD